MRVTLWVFMAILTLWISGCATKNATDASKQAWVDPRLTQSDPDDLDKERPWKILLDKEGRLLRMGRIDWRFCHSDDFFVVYDGFRYAPPPYVPLHKETECGRGNAIGWPALLYPPMLFEKHDGFLCHYPFTRLTGVDLGKRAVIGMLTYGTSFVTAGTLHTVAFDPKAFKDMTERSGLVRMRKQIDLVMQNAARYETAKIAVLQTTPETMEKDIDALIDRLVRHKERDDALVVVDEKEKVMMAFAPLETTLNPSTDLRRFFDRLSDTTLIQGADHTVTEAIRRSLPPLPHYTPPPTPTLVKGPYETKKAFLKRVEKAKNTWQQEADKRYESYKKALEAYKRTLARLDRKLKSSRHGLARRWRAFQTAFYKNYAPLAKLAIVLRTTPARIEDPRYDPDAKRLYLRICQANKTGCGRYVTQKVEAAMAKRIIEKSDYTLTPRLNIQKNRIERIGWMLESGGERRVLTPTQTRFEPIEMAVRIPTARPAFASENLGALRRSKIRYANAVKIRRWVVKTLDPAKIELPEWFAHPDKSLAGYGMGADKAEALAEALHNLSLMLGARIQSESRYMTQMDQNELRRRLNVTRQIVRSDHPLPKGAWRIDKEAFKNGWWFVKVVYTEGS